MTVRRPRVTIAGPRMTVRRPRVTIAGPRMTVRRPRTSMPRPEVVVARVEAWPLRARRCRRGRKLSKFHKLRLEVAETRDVFA
jgi:hypothetical protein